MIGLFLQGCEDFFINFLHPMGAEPFFDPGDGIAYGAVTLQIKIFPCIFQRIPANMPLKL